MTPAPASRFHEEFNALMDVDQVPPINDHDLDCLAEVRDVLKKFGKQDRFGVALLHKHFDLQPGEVLLEETDVTTRMSTLRPIMAGAAGSTMETLWQLGDGDAKAMLGCRSQCQTDVHGNHSSFHTMT